MRSNKNAAQDAALRRFLQQMRNALEKSAFFLAQNRQNPLILHRHFGSIQTILERFHEFQYLFISSSDNLLAANLIIAIGRWPARWGVFYVWKNELEFAIKTYKKNGHLKLEAEAACSLAHLYSVSSADGDLRLANRWATLAVKKAYRSEDVLAIGQAVYMHMQILIKSTNNKIIPLLYEQAIRSIDNIPSDADARLTARAFLCIPYARFLHRSGETKKAIESLAENIFSLLPKSNFNLDILSELYDLRGVLYWADGNYQAALDDFDLEHALLINYKLDVNNLDYEQAEMDAFTIPVLANRALVFNSLGKLEEAAKMTAWAIDLSRKINAFSLLMARIGDMSWNQLSRGELKDALDSTNEQLRMARIANDVDQEYLAIYNRASIRMFLGYPQEAYPDLLNLLSIFKRRKNTIIYAGLLIDLSVCFWHLSDLENAAKYYQKACDFVVSHRLEAFEPGVLRCGALLEDRLNAKTNLEKALQLSRKLHRKYEEAACLLHLAYLNDEFDIKEAYWYQAISLLKDMDALAWAKNKGSNDFVLLPFISS